MPSVRRSADAWPDHAAERAGLTPKFRLLGYGHAGVRPEVMGIGPVPAVANLMTKTGLTIHDFDVVDIRCFQGCF